MRAVDARTGIEWLDREECLALLGAEVVGRLGIVAGGAPTIFPVNYALDGDTVVFRIDPGTKLDQGPRAPVCFEIDRVDPGRRTGWSVVVAGRLEEVTAGDAATFDRVRRVPVQPWAGGDKDHWMRVVPSSITGRRIPPAQP